MAHAPWTVPGDRRLHRRSVDGLDAQFPLFYPSESLQLRPAVAPATGLAQTSASRSRGRRSSKASRCVSRPSPPASRGLETRRQDLRRGQCNDSERFSRWTPNTEMARSHADAWR
jgi:hypothetical protein